MAVRDYCSSEVRTVKGKATLREAAQLMADEGVGCLVVLRGSHARAILTDRDLAIRVIRDGIDPDATKIATLLSEDESPAVVNGNASLDIAMLLMRRRGVRRLVVVDQMDEVTGIITLDDLVPVLSKELASVASVLSAQMPGTKSTQIGGSVADPEGA